MMFACTRCLLVAALALTACDSSDTTERNSGGGDSTAAASGPSGVTPAPEAAAGASVGGAMLDPNTATKEQLMTLPGMTAMLADSLMARRPFDNMIAMDRVVAAQIADTTARDTLYARLWKPIDLNSATRAELLLIPGVGPRMAHEFEEYRPYDGIERFRREIGKYVKPDEVARLEKYVTIVQK